ncbi:MAG: adenylate/guanylate cyclase domain-containing protein [Chloroflexi bacterium]|nr:adenylate/guanylate cyclase domain-containing protein [Chloroflexota bacterium]
MDELTLTNSAHHLQQLLYQRNEFPDRAAEIDAEIVRVFQQRRSVLALDLCGFARTVHHRGIIHFLALIERVSRLIRPIIEDNGGHLVKSEADNVFALFNNPDASIACAEDIMQALAAVNAVLPEQDEIHCSVGIGYGDLLVVAGEDLWGDEMNLASKLGEDLAARGEVLLTEAAYEALTRGKAQCAKVELSVSGLRLDVYRFTPRRRG